MRNIVDNENQSPIITDSLALHNYNKLVSILRAAVIVPTEAA